MILIQQNGAGGDCQCIKCVCLRTALDLFAMNVAALFSYEIQLVENIPHWNGSKYLIETSLRSYNDTWACIAHRWTDMCTIIVACEIRQYTGGKDGANLSWLS